MAHLLSAVKVLVNCILIATLVAAQDAKFISPPNENDNNPDTIYKTYTIGQTYTFEWDSTFFHTNIAIYQNTTDGGPSTGVHIQYPGNATSLPENVSTWTWTVNISGDPFVSGNPYFDLQYGNVFYLTLWQSGSDSPTATSEYFVIQSASSQPASSSISSSTSSSSSSSSSTTGTGTSSATTSSSQSATADNSKSSSNSVAIGVGVGVGVGVVVLGALIFGVWFCLRRRRQQQADGPFTLPLSPHSYSSSPKTHFGGELDSKIAGGPQELSAERD